MVWKGFVVIVALIAFFFCEKIINAVGECRRRRRTIKASHVTRRAEIFLFYKLNFPFFVLHTMRPGYVRKVYGLPFCSRCTLHTVLNLSFGILFD